MRIWLIAATALLSASYPLEGGRAQDARPTISVRVTDLDLTTVEGRATLDRRVAAAAHEACRDLAVGSPFDWTVVTQCERTMLAQTRDKVALAAAEARRRSRLARNGIGP